MEQVRDLHAVETAELGKLEDVNPAAVDATLVLRDRGVSLPASGG
jgi:hypothetical protein